MSSSSFCVQVDQDDADRVPRGADNLLDRVADQLGVRVEERSVGPDDQDPRMGRALGWRSMSWYTAGELGSAPITDILGWLAL